LGNGPALTVCGVTPEDLAGYVYCLLAHPEYTSRFSSELINREVRVPLTKNKKFFLEAAEIGKYLIWLHTYGERLYNSKDRPKGKIPKGSAKNLQLSMTFIRNHERMNSPVNFLNFFGL
jgi:predicted helicase